MYNRIIEHCEKDPELMSLVYLSPDYIKQNTEWVYDTKMKLLPEDLIVPIVCEVLMNRHTTDEYTEDFIDPGEQDDDHCIVWEEYDEDYELFGW